METRETVSDSTNEPKTFEPGYLSTFGFQYECNGHSYALDVCAHSPEEAQERVSRMSSASFIGKLQEENPSQLAIYALDLLAVALAEHGHVWTEEERRAYEVATGKEVR